MSKLKTYKFFLPILISYFLFLTSPTPAYAHAFGQQYILPVPFSLYAYGAAAAVILSFVIIGYFISENEESEYKKIDISKNPIIGLLRNPKSIAFFQTTSVVLFLITIVTGILGTQEATANFNMTFFWVIRTIGLTYLCAAFGNVYEALNPWKTLTLWIEALSHESLTGITKYPTRLGYYPAFILFILFIWVELMGRVTPLELSILIVLYTLITFLGVYIFGKRSWFQYGEFFGIFFEFISTTSIIETDKNKTFLRFPFAGLVKRRASSSSEVLFILFMLASTSYDGFRDTTVWWNIYFTIAQGIQNILGIFTSIILQTLGLIVSPFLFLIIYILILFVIKIIVQSKYSLNDLAKGFAYSLIPIALVYNIAHYYTLLLIQGQSIISLISDPLGKGWNVFGTSSFTPNISIVSTSFIWNSQVAAILFGHIAAIFVAHKIALQLFSSHKKALLSQVPMLVLMVMYTVLGLWILSQPLSGA